MAADKEPANLSQTGQQHSDPKNAAAAFTRFANTLETIRHLWIEGDWKTTKLLVGGVRPETGGYEGVVRGEVRQRLDRALKTLRSDLLPAALAHADPNLRDRLLRVTSDSALDDCLPDREGQSSIRWRQSWIQTGLDREYEELIAILRAASGKTGESSEVLGSWADTSHEQRMRVLKAVRREQSTPNLSQLCRVAAGRFNPKANDGSMRSWVNRQEGLRDELLRPKTL